MTKWALSQGCKDSSVQFSHSVVSDSLQPHESQHASPPCPSPSPGVHADSRPSSPWCHPSSHLIPGRPLLLLPPIPPSIRIFSNESTLHMKWPKYWSFSFSISPFIEYLVLISFRIDWFDLLAVQGILKSLFQHHSLKASIIQFVNVVNYIDWFVDIEESLHPWDKAHLVMVYDLFNVLLDSDS